MKQNPILITAAALALSAWPLRAQENAPQPPQREDVPRRPDAERPEAPRDHEARPQNRDGEPGEGRFRRDDGQMHRPDRGPDQRHEDGSARQDGPPRQQTRPEGDSRRGDQLPAPMQGERRQGPPVDSRGGGQGPQFGPQGGGPGMNMRPPQMEQRGGPSAGSTGDFRMAQRPEGMRRHHRRMMDSYGFAPQRGDGQDFRRGGDEMRAPMPPPQRGPQFDRVGPGNGPAPSWNQRPQFNGPREMMNSRPEFAPQNRGDQRQGFVPRGDFNGPRPPMSPPFGNDGGPRPQRPHRDDPPQPGWEENRRPDFN